MGDHIHIEQQSDVSGTVHGLPSSKSLSNRALLINALLGGTAYLENLSTANDTRLMKELLHTTNDVIDVQDAGTVMRFLTAYYAISGQSRKITGTSRMQKRPIGELVEALRILGARIDYGAAEGYPPLHIRSFSGQRAKTLTLRGDVSSQFISALMMVAPLLPEGLTIELTGKISSRPYLSMTAEVMSIFGIHPKIGKTSVQIPAGRYQTATYRVEPDWSAASYWFAFAALAKTSNILLPAVSEKAVQGDRVIVDIMKRLGVTADFGSNGLRLAGGGACVKQLQLDFSDCPDLAQTVLPVCAALGVDGLFTGMDSLRVKETDRIAALQIELRKVGATLEENQGAWTLLAGKKELLPKNLSIQTYDDHRMAMGFAPFSALTQVTIEHPEVVRKSYPDFWNDMESIGFVLSV